MAKHLPAATLAKWLEDPNTPTYRYGLYASMLGHCGNDQHAQLLRKMLDDAQKQKYSGVDGILAGYTILRPREGWEYCLSMLKDPAHDFMIRYAALRAIRFFWDFRPDLVEQKDLVAGVAMLLDQTDICDLAIEDLRKWKRWELAERVLSLYDKKSHDIPIVRRGILKYALSAPLPSTTAFINAQRMKNAEEVRDVEELLNLENAAPPPKPAAAPKK
jgi:hypothetical protein